MNHKYTSVLSMLRYNITKGLRNRDQAQTDTYYL